MWLVKSLTPGEPQNSWQMGYSSTPKWSHRLCNPWPCRALNCSHFQSFSFQMSHNQTRVQKWSTHHASRTKKPDICSYFLSGSSLSNLHLPVLMVLNWLLPCWKCRTFHLRPRGSFREHGLDGEGGALLGRKGRCDTTKRAKTKTPPNRGFSCIFSFVSQWG